MRRLLGFTVLAGMAGCGPGEPDAALFARALASATPTAGAVRACRAIADPGTRGECLATLVRGRPDLAGEACERIDDERWLGECRFSVAERLAYTGDRWSALQECGRSGPFYDECLYHLWTAEMARGAEAAGDALSALQRGRETVAFWSAIQTVGADPETLMWNDWWFFAHNAHRPADLAACGGIADPGEHGRCVEGTRAFVLRALLGALLAPGAPAGLLDRVCRSGEIPDIYLAGLYVPEPSLDAQVARAAELACVAAEGKPIRRWNPVFSPRSPRW